MAHETDTDRQPASAAALTGLAAVRQHTTALHRQLEALPLARAMLSPTLDRPMYARALAGWAAAWWPLEQAIASSRHAAALGRLRPPARHALALADLRCLGQGTGAPHDADGMHGPGGPAQEASLRALQTAIDSTAALLGLCYVLRGAALGSQVIAAHLRNTLGLDSGSGASFFATRTPDALTWPAWMAAADPQLAGATATAQACAGAAAGFSEMMAGFARWPAAIPPR